MCDTFPGMSLLEHMHELQTRERHFMRRYKFRKIFNSDLQTNEYFVQMILNLVREFDQSCETTFDAIFIYQYVIEKTKPKGQQYLLIVLASLLLSSKLHESKSKRITLDHFRGYFNVDVKKIKTVEAQICDIFDWSFCFVTPQSFLSLLLQSPLLYEGYQCPDSQTDFEKSGLHKVHKEYALLLLQVAVQDIKHVQFRPSILASSVLYYTRKKNNICSEAQSACDMFSPHWTRDLVLFTQIEEAQLRDCVSFIEHCFDKYAESVK